MPNNFDSLSEGTKKRRIARRGEREYQAQARELASAAQRTFDFKPPPSESLPAALFDEVIRDANEHNDGFVSMRQWQIDREIANA